MLISFPIPGYGIFSILFSTLTIFVSYMFAILYWNDLNRLTNKTTTHLWLKASLLFSAISSFGAFSLAYMMVTQNIHQNLYLSAVYFFLHFQYNGWFFFACMGLIIHKIFSDLPDKNLKYIFWLFAIACLV